MADSVTIDLRQVARGLSIPVPQVQTVVELLDEGNTVPFITRYRKDRTGGLDEEQIRQIQARLAKARQLADRKETILRSIDSQGKLTDALAKQIRSASTTKRLEDLYLPFKPKKQTLATAARGRGLEPLAREILEADPLCADLDARAADFVNTDREVPTGADALLGAGHILAEQFSERAELRQKLREILQRTGKFVSTQIGAETKPDTKPEAAKQTAKETPKQPETKADAQAKPENTETAQPENTETPKPEEAPAAPEAAEAKSDPQSEAPEAAKPSEPETKEPEAPPETPPSETPAADAATSDAPEEPPADKTEDNPAPADPSETTAEAIQVGETTEVKEPPAAETPTGAEAKSQDAPASDPPATENEAKPAEGETESAKNETPSAEGEAKPSETSPGATPETPEAEKTEAEKAEAPKTDAPKADAPKTETPPKPKAKPKPPKPKLSKRELKKKKADEKKIKAYQDYFDYSEEIKKIPHHRVLALNRGERAKVLRVKIEVDLEAMGAAVDELLIPEGHPHAEYLRGCARDAMTRLILPSLEREVRRELTDRAELHAVGVFAKNLRNLLLQPPIHDRRVLAVDPGFKSGCKIVALDQFGNVLAHDVIYLVGRAERRDKGKQKVIEMIQRFQLTVVVIGNGTGCRETEDFFSAMIGAELKDLEAAYVIVNEAGASVYSTSRLGREEFPNYDATLRGAISIGRRLQDPLSELVKIDPASIGVGLYQHDVKGKHLRASLDEVVESCVNYVGVDVNVASPALLGYVSGLNQLTARRVYEHRRENGPFRTREQLRAIAGFGEATFVQAAGFLKINSGQNPLDATWIHPESYDAATKVLEKLGFAPTDLADKAKTATIAEQAAKVNAAEMSAELEIGALLLKDILGQLTRPGRDPREDLPKPVFKHGVIKLEDLEAGMELTGTVLNVVDFGCFVDIGMHDSGLVHVSQLADKFVRDPHEVVSVGGVVKVWVVDVDKERRRVSLTMIKPGSERPKRQRRGKPSGKPAEGEKSEKGKPQGGRQRSEQRGGKPREGQKGREGQRGRGGRPQGRGKPGQRGRGGPRQRKSYETRSNKPTKPITEGMKAGDEPMRTFGDLMQFYQEKDKPNDPPKPESKKPAANKPKKKAPKEESVEKAVGKAEEKPDAPKPEESVAASQPETAQPQSATPPADPPPAEQTPTESTPAESTPAESTPAESTPAESTPAEPTPATEAKPAETPTEAPPNDPKPEPPATE